MDYKKNWEELREYLMQVKEKNKPSIYKKPIKYANPYKIIDLSLESILKKMDKIERND